LSNRGAFYLFLAGTLISAVLFLVLTVDTHRQVGALTNADQLTEEVVEGKRVWHKHECNLCHTILGFGGYYAPDMTRVHQRIGAEGIKASVLRPEEVFADSFRKMPNLGVTEEEADQLVAFLEWTGNIDNNDWPPQDSRDRQQNRLRAAGLSQGAAAYSQFCMGCHSLDGQGGNIGPDLNNVGLKYSPEEIAQFIGDPQSVDPESTMPPQPHVEEDDRQAIGEFLAGQQ
jgi:nitric oxide reductase subunit C